MKLTDATIDTLEIPEGKQELIAFDDDLPGFGIRIRSGGSRRFVFQYKLHGTNRRVTFKEANVKRARAAAQVLAAKVTLGSDPALEKSNAHDAAGDTFKRCLDRYLARPQGRRRDSTMVEVRRHLERNLQPLHRHHIKAITRRQVADQLERLTSEIGPVQSNRTRSSLFAFMNWSIGEGYLDINVAAQTNKNEEVARDRVLSDTELKTIWNALPEPGDDYGDIIRLLVLTACRLREIGDLRWSEVDIAKATITIKANRSKNRREHIVPLSPPALTILQARPQGERQLVFGRGKGGFDGFSRAKNKLGAATRLNEDWTHHDIRRTAATGLAALGVQPHIVESCLGHISGFKAGVAGIYNQHPYETEKRAALDLWSKHVMALVNGA
jgi:integrase